jgi:hypothetical protein
MYQKCVRGYIFESFLYYSDHRIRHRELIVTADRRRSAGGEYAQRGCKNNRKERASIYY